MDNVQFGRSVSLMVALSIAMGLVIVASVYMNSGDIQRVPLLPTTIACVIPWLVSVFLLIKGSKRNQTGAGAGIAAGLALPTACILPILIIILMLNDSRNITAANHTLMLLFLFVLYVLFESFRLSRIHGAAFGIALGISAAYTVASAGAISMMETPQERTGKAQRMVGNEALYGVRSLTACLLRYGADHPETGFPQNLSASSGDSGCDEKLAGLEKIPVYRLSYEPRRDSASGRVADFQLTFIPKKRGPFGADPVMSDGTGLVFTWYTWSDGGRTVPRLEAWSSDLENSCLWEIRTDFEKYVQQYGTPNSFDDVFKKFPNLHGWQKADGDEGRTILEGAHVLSYTLSNTNPPRIEMVATCQSYGEQCIRSYVADFDGAIHWTALPRSANLADPVLNRLPTGAPCEGPSWPGNPPCDSVQWAMP